MHTILKKGKLTLQVIAIKWRDKKCAQHRHCAVNMKGSGMGITSCTDTRLKSNPAVPGVGRNSRPSNSFLGGLVAKAE
jgi:hypothetical protein